ncbi:lytic transglycosylase domain-containing protein [Paraconexibacter antarcticus]|uniref:Lytic transglycosylase domain-containing protein n=1 Tax=Paraconexibacter antarcticus TaxID=2949664 RepID=A0ABY5DVW8_9ACTN|nr:lytic transglycosylase domain-containing protein [Paraconexibacter antarcticus]UTI66140.1 lytic transglycosylase domain-containing protein [Paraconexibacter antarcticus]
MRRASLIVPVVVVAGFGLSAVMLGGWFLLAAGATGNAGCAETASLKSDEIPAELAPIFAGAAAQYGFGPDGAAILAGLTKVESDFGRNRSTSSAGAVGWTQFLPDTWRTYGVDADGDGRRDPQDAADAIYSTANYLRHLGAPGDWHRALFGYNHADWYVTKVLNTARQLTAQGPSASPVIAETCGTAPVAIGGPVHRVFGGGRLVPIPGAAGITVDERILPDLLALQARYRFKVTAGYAPTGHAADGEHPLGLAVDLVPGPGGSWDDIDALAHWAEPIQNRPRPPFRWVGYDGDPGHGRGNHLHLSWRHAPAPPGARPVTWVQTLAGAR